MYMENMFNIEGGYGHMPIIHTDESCKNSEFEWNSFAQCSSTPCELVIDQFTNKMHFPLFLFCL